GASLRRVELEVAVAQHRGNGRLRASEEGVDACDEHGEVERFGEIVVGATVEPVDEVVRGGRGGEHEDSAATAGVDDLGADLVAVQTRQVAVEHDHVVVVADRPGEPRHTVEGDVNGHLSST